MKPITFIILIFLLVVPVSAIQVCNCDRSTNPNAYCISYGNKVDCGNTDRFQPSIERITIIESIPDGSKEYPIQWDADNPPSNGKGWYYYVSPNRPFFLPYNYPTIVR